MLGLPDAQGVVGLAKVAARVLPLQPRQLQLGRPADNFPGPNKAYVIESARRVSRGTDSMLAEDQAYSKTHIGARIMNLVLPKIIGYHIHV